MKLKSTIQSILCCVGYHKWKFEMYTTKHGYAIGDKCSRCGVWSKKHSIKSEWTTEQYDNEF